MALPATAAARGTVASINSCPARRPSARLASVSDWLRNGTLRITVSAARGGAGVVVGGELAVGQRLLGAGGGFAGPARVAGADRDRDPGAGEAQRQTEAERARGADHRDRISALRWHAGRV